MQANDQDIAIRRGCYDDSDREWEGYGPLTEEDAVALLAILERDE